MLFCQFNVYRNSKVWKNFFADILFVCSSSFIHGSPENFVSKRQKKAHRGRAYWVRGLIRLATIACILILLCVQEGGGGMTPSAPFPTTPHASAARTGPNTTVCFFIAIYTPAICICKGWKVKCLEFYFISNLLDKVKFQSLHMQIAGV